jgi:hypothetical protein
MRESILHMYWWILGSFGAIDLRTVNRDPTFFTVEIFAFANLATTLYFSAPSPHRVRIAFWDDSGRSHATPGGPLWTT